MPPAVWAGLVGCRRRSTTTSPTWKKQHPELTILRQVTFSQPRTALLDATAEAQLIVVGNRGRGGISGMLLGSVAQAIIHHASETGAAMGRISCQHGTLAGQSLTLGG
jgi:Universal stress protein family